MSLRGRAWLACLCNGFQELAQSSDRFRAQRQPKDGRVWGIPFPVDARLTLIKDIPIDDNDVSPTAPQEVEGLVGTVGPLNVGRLVESGLQAIDGASVSNDQKMGTFARLLATFRTDLIWTCNVKVSQAFRDSLFDHSDCALFALSPDVA
jgi:hypothetical protein